jgi:hypothetical protein
LSHSHPRKRGLRLRQKEPHLKNLSVLRSCPEVKFAGGPENGWTIAAPKPHAMNFSLSFLRSAHASTAQMFAGNHHPHSNALTLQADSL